VVKLFGEYQNTLDDKGRVSIPAPFREKLQENVLFLAKGTEHCIWVLPPEQFENFVTALVNNRSLSIRKASLIRRQFIASAQKVEIDKAGRVAILQSLRDYAGLSRECSILGNGQYIEIWDTETYRSYLNTNEDVLLDVLEELGPLDLFS
jgi:MraZ protein